MMKKDVPARFLFHLFSYETISSKQRSKLIESPGVNVCHDPILVFALYPHGYIPPWVINQ